MTDHFYTLPAEFLESEAGENAAELRELRICYDNTDPNELWREYGVIREEITGKYSVLSPVNSENERPCAVFCFHDEGESTADAEVYGFAHLSYRTGVTVICPESDDVSVLPQVISVFKEKGITFKKILVFGKGKGAAAAVRCATEYSESVNGVACAFADDVIKDIDFTSLCDMPIMLFDGSTDGKGVFTASRSICDYLKNKNQKNYYSMVEGIVWAVSDSYDDNGCVTLRYMNGVGLPHVITGSIAPLTLSFFNCIDNS